MIARLWLGFLLLLPLSAYGASPDYDSPLHPWIAVQHSITGAWCCNISDGYLLEDEEWRANGSVYQVMIDGKWMDIPADALRDPNGGPNPTGKAIVWYVKMNHAVHIFCFAPGTQW